MLTQKFKELVKFLFFIVPTNKKRKMYGRNVSQSKIEKPEKPYLQTIRDTVTCRGYHFAMPPQRSSSWGKPYRESN